MTHQILQISYTAVGFATLIFALNHPEIKVEPTPGWFFASLGLIISWPVYWMAMVFRRLMAGKW